MTRTRTLVVAGLACAAGFLVALVPATLVTSQLGNAARVTGVSGTLWNGEIARLNVQGLVISDLRWSVNWLSFLRGRLGADIDAGIPGGRAQGQVAVGLGGSISVRNFEANAAAKPFGPLLGLPRADGELVILIEDLVIDDKWPRRLIGNGRIADFPLMPDGTLPASFQVSFAAESVPPDGVLDGQLKDVGGPMEVSGNVRLTPPGNYELSGKVRARGDAPSELAESLAFFGPPDAGGRRDFTLAGSI